ncbi:MAG: glutamate synthase [Clostridia bacterium]
MQITAGTMDFRDLNNAIRDNDDSEVVIDQCYGQRFIGDGMSGKTITINGTPGNALGAYFNGGIIRVNGNAQDAMGDTMNEGTIYVHGNSGDATGYAMRGGRIFVKGNAGYRAGIHMKAYKDKIPTLVIGGRVGSFLGEYQAGGYIVVLGIGEEGRLPVGNFLATGMHGGKIFLRSDAAPTDLPKSVLAKEASPEDMAEIGPLVEEYCREFGGDKAAVLNGKFYVVYPDTANPYKELFVAN